MIPWRFGGIGQKFCSLQIQAVRTSGFGIFLALQGRLEDVFYCFEDAALNMDGCTIYMMIMHEMG
jgi:hypothetical protein